MSGAFPPTLKHDWLCVQKLYLSMLLSINDEYVVGLKVQQKNMTVIIYHALTRPNSRGEILNKIQIKIKDVKGSTVSWVRLSL